MTTTPLFPIAISSQLDDTGVERVHAADLTPVTRASYFVVPTQLYGTVILDAGWLNSIDGGDTFNYVPPPDTPGVFVGTTMFITQVGQYLWRAGSSSGNYNWRYSSDGITWSSSMTMTPTFSTLGILWTGSAYVLWGSEYTFISATGADGTWSAARTTVAGGGIASCANIGDTLVATRIDSSSLRVSQDAGTSWATVTLTGNVGMVFADSANFLAFDFSSNTVHISPTGLAGSWQAVVISPPEDGDGAFTACKDDDSRWLYIASNGKCFVSDNDGTSWAQGALLPSDGSLGSPYNNAAVFADGYFYALSLNSGDGSSNGIFRSPDGVEPWVLVHSEGVDTGIVLGKFKPL